MSRSRRTAWTFAFSLAANVSVVIVGLLTTPLLLCYLGDERLGTYRIATEWVGYLALLDLGITGSLQVTFARSIGSGDRPGITAAVRAGTRLGSLLAMILVVIGIGLALTIPRLYIRLSTEVANELQIGLMIAAVGGLLAPFIAFRPLAEAGQRGYLVHMSLVVQSWLTAALAIGLAIAGAGLPGQFLAVVVGQAVGCLIPVWDAVRRYPELLSRSIPTVALPVALSGSMFAYNLLGRVGLSSDGIIIGLTLGPTAVVGFMVTQRLLLLADAQMLGLGSAAWAALADLHYKGESARFHRRLTQLTLWSGVIGIALIVPLIFASHRFVALWVGLERYGGGLLVVATGVYVWVHVIVALWGWPLITTGRVRLVLPIYMVGIPINLALSVGGAFWLGVAGPAIGSAVSLCLVWLWTYPFLLRREFGTPIRPLARAVCGPAILAVPYAAGLFVVSEVCPIDEFPVWRQWLILGLVVPVAFAGYLLLAWLLIVPQEDRDEFRTRVLGR